MRSHYIAIRMAKANKQTDKQTNLTIPMVDKGVEQWDLSYTTWWDCRKVQSFWKIIWQFCKKGHTHLPYDPKVELLGFYSRKMNSEVH